MSRSSCYNCMPKFHIHSLLNTILGVGWPLREPTSSRTVGWNKTSTSTHFADRGSFRLWSVILISASNELQNRGYIDIQMHTEFTATTTTQFNTPPQAWSCVLSAELSSNERTNVSLTHEAADGLRLLILWIIATHVSHAIDAPMYRIRRKRAWAVIHCYLCRSEVQSGDIEARHQT